MEERGKFKKVRFSAYIEKLICMFSSCGLTKAFWMHLDCSISASSWVAPASLCPGGLGCAVLGWCGFWGTRPHSCMPNPCPPAVHPLHCKGLTGTPEKVLIGYLGIRVNMRAYILLKLVCYIYSNSWKFLSLEASWKEMWPLCLWQIIISFPEVMSMDNHSNELSDI